ncbi:hypothetical protein DL96DRAFT_1625034 [Flagelloscypha sp. PMI_526]|nr:hypothetical protein DL96DRAFT_1625034 [Flagelloscypha sp. PMI_526]
MGTPNPGTIQHHDLDVPQQSFRDWEGYFGILFQLTIVFTGYNIGACALGGLFLDCFHLRDRDTPSDVSVMDKYAELIGAVLAAWLSVPVFAGLAFILKHGIEGLKHSKIIFQFLDHEYTFAAVLFLAQWFGLLLAGAILHPKFHYVDAVSLFGLYWLGTLILILLCILAVFSYGVWHKRRR